jgi:hypothetical protein
MFQMAIEMNAVACMKCYAAVRKSTIDPFNERRAWVNIQHPASGNDRTIEITIARKHGGGHRDAAEDVSFAASKD